MRRAYNNEVIKKNGKIVGINLGADFTSEHEWGIDGIKRSFGIDSKKIGIDGRSINTVPETLYRQEVKIHNKKYYVLILLRYALGSWYCPDRTQLIDKDIQSFELNPNDKGISTAWDESSFGILVDENNKNVVEDLYEAFKNKDIVIGVSPSGVFQNGGLKILVKSEIEKEVVNSIKESDLDAIRLKEAAEKTGIHKILEKAGKKYFALSPRWKDDTKKEVIFWLNPYEQNIHNFGWFGVEELKQWAEDKGVVMMKK